MRDLEFEQHLRDMKAFAEAQVRSNTPAPSVDPWPASARFEDDPRAVRADRHGPKPVRPRLDQPRVMIEGRAE